MEQKRKMIDQNAELNDDVLGTVSGGTGSSTINTCSNFVCVWCGCGKEAGKSGHHCERQGGPKDPASWFDYTCEWCEHLYSCPIASEQPEFLITGGRSMENKLVQLFDRQRFQQNPRLAKIIGDVEERYATALSDDNLELVSAAGDADAGSDYIMNTMFVDSQRTPPERPEDRTP